MPRVKRKTAQVETPTDPEELLATLPRQGTFTKTPERSPSNTNSEDQETASPPLRATRGRAKKNKKSGSPPKPTRTMPRRGRKQVQFAEYVQAISEEVPDVKENVEPVSVDQIYTSPPKQTRKRTRKTKKAVEIPSDLEPPVSLVREDTFTRSPDRAQSPSGQPLIENTSKKTAPATQKRSRRGKRSKEDNKTIVGENTITKRPEKKDVHETQESPKEKASTARDSSDSATDNSSEEMSTKKRPRRGKGSKEAPNIPQAMVREGTFTKSPEKNVDKDASETHSSKSSQKRGRAKRSKDEPREPPGIAREGTPSKSLEMISCPDLPKPSEEGSPCSSADIASEVGSQEAQPGLVREGTFTKSPAKDITNKIAESPQNTNRKRKRSSYTVVPATEDSPPGEPASATPIRTPKMPHREEETNSSPVSQRRATFTKTPRRSQRSTHVLSEQENTPAGLQREGTFTKSSEKEPVRTGAGQNAAVDAPGLKREGTFTKTSEKEDTVIPDFQASVSQTPGPIGNMSVFQRLSSKIPLSERRSLVMSEKRGSLRNTLFTPQIDKKAQLSALRDARKNHLTPKSINFKRGTTPTAAHPATASSTKKPKSAVKKAPNFAAIHERNFAKMESLAENKKRLRERANFLMSPLRPTQASGIPKLVKKVVAPVAKAPVKSNIPIMKIAAKERLKAAVANKCTTGAMLKAPNSKVLKGVRTNKGFELRLKQKNMKM